MNRFITVGSGWIDWMTTKSVQWVGGCWIDSNGVNRFNDESVETGWIDSMVILAKCYVFEMGFYKKVGFTGYNLIWCHNTPIYQRLVFINIPQKMRALQWYLPNHWMIQNYQYPRSDQTTQPIDFFLRPPQLTLICFDKADEVLTLDQCCPHLKSQGTSLVIRTLGYTEAPRALWEAVHPRRPSNKNNSTTLVYQVSTVKDEHKLT